MLWNRLSWNTKCEIFWWLRLLYYCIAASVFLWAPVAVFTLLAAWAC